MTTKPGIAVAHWRSLGFVQLLLSSIQQETLLSNPPTSNLSSFTEFDL